MFLKMKMNKIPQINEKRKSAISIRKENCNWSAPVAKASASQPPPSPLLLPSLILRFTISRNCFQLNENVINRNYSAHKWEIFDLIDWKCMAKSSVVAECNFVIHKCVCEKERKRSRKYVCVCAPLGYCIPIIVCPFRSGISINKTTLSTLHWIWTNVENQQRSNEDEKDEMYSKRFHWTRLYFVVVKQLFTTIYCFLPPYQINSTAIFSLLLVYISLLLDGYSFKYN